MHTNDGEGHVCDHERPQRKEHKGTLGPLLPVSLS
jgi:hypothetical protein